MILPSDTAQLAETNVVHARMNLPGLLVHGTPGIVSDVFNISEVFQCHKSACQGLMLS